MKPLLFVDIDGVLNQMGPDREKFPGRVKTKLDGQKFVYDPMNLQRCQRLLELYDWIWASKGWEGREELVAELFQLPSHLPELSIPDHPDLKGGTKADFYPGKLEAIELYARNRPFAILDDKGGPEVDAWCAKRLCCQVRPDPQRGMDEEDFNELVEFARKVHRMTLGPRGVHA